MLHLNTEILISISILGIILIFSIVFLVLNIYTYQKKLVQKQQDLFSAVISSQEAEQTRIAHDLHDQIGPLLSIIKSQVNAIDNHTLSAIDLELKTNVDNYLTQAVLDIRNIAHNLLPATFAEYGFEKSVLYYVMRVKELRKININYKINNWPNNLKKSVEISIYRIIQELFNNTFKHAQAKNIKLNIVASNKQVYLLYNDDGIGFDTNVIKNGIGFVSIHNRVNLLNGKVNLTSQIGFGTTIKIEIKL